MPRPARPLTVLVYHPDEAERYAGLVHADPADVTLRVCGTREEAARAAPDADVVYAWLFPHDLYARAGRLRWLQAMGAGVDWALSPSLPPHVTLTRARGVFGPWMVEYVLGWTLWVTQRMETFTEAKRERRWLRDVIPGRLRGRTMTIVGLGDIGRAIGRAARVLGVRVHGVSLSGRPARGIDRVFGSAELLPALAAADFVVLTVPLTEATRGLIGREALAAMKRSAWLVNIARGEVVDEPALVEALETHRIAGAILDVFATEPLPESHPLWRLGNAILTPHISGPSTPEEIAPVFDDNLARYLAGRALRFVVDRTRGY